MTSIRNKERPFRILKYLYENTDENHPISTAELVRIFVAEEANAKRKTIKDDIDILMGEGFDIVRIRSRNHSFFLRNRMFELPELKLLIDAVSSSRFINKEKSSKLISKLSSMVSRHQTESICRHLYTPNRIKTVDQRIYCIVDLINDAINEGKKIRFRCFDYNGKKEKCLCNDGVCYCVSPYALVWDDNRYYMIGYSDAEQMIANYRVDRMCSAGVTEEKAVSLPDGFNIQDYVQRQYRRLAGDHVEVILECHDDLMGYIIDEFGEEVETWMVSEDAFRAKVNVQDIPTFYSWVFQFEGKIQIAEPEETREKYRSMVKAANRMLRKKRKEKSE